MQEKKINLEMGSLFPSLLQSIQSPFKDVNLSAQEPFVFCFFFSALEVLEKANPSSMSSAVQCEG